MSGPARRLFGIFKGFFAIYCILTCSIVLLVTYLLTISPFLLLSTPIERRCQELLQKLWVYLLLGVTANAADSELLVTLPEECGPAMEAAVYQRLRDGFQFDQSINSRFHKLVREEDRQRDIIISNHQIYMDWIYIWAVMARLRREGSVKIILKRSLLNVPIFGLGMKLLNFIFLHRNWQVDRIKFGRRLRRLVFGTVPFSLVIFPEGTTLCENSVTKSTKFAEINQLNIPKHTITPRVTGMQFALSTLGDHIGGIFDLTIGYSGTTTTEYPEDTFGLKSLFFNGLAPRLIHVHVKYHHNNTVPFSDPEAFKIWLYQRFDEKDALMAKFYKDGCFPGPKSKSVPVAPDSAVVIIVLATIMATMTLFSTGGSKKRNVSSSSESEDDLQELLGKISRQHNLGQESTQARTVVDRPSPRVNAIFVANPMKKGEILVFGGERQHGNKCEFFGDTFLFDTASNVWTRLNLMVGPSPRSAHQAVTLPNGKILVFGGEFGTSKETKFLHFSDTWVFDFNNYSWQALTLKIHPSSRSGHRIAVYGRYAVLFGGFFDTGSQAKYLDDLWIFDTEEMQWIKVDWMNEYESRPSARSGFTFVTHPEGILLYSGYTQFKSKKGEMQGQVINDLWLLRINPSDIKDIRWKKLKLTPNAPIPRSGSTSIAADRQLINFGGVIDEEISDEFLMGTCVNGIYKMDYANNGWSQLDPMIKDFESDAFCGRFNSMLTLVDNNLYVYGGTFEVGDQQFTLDDLFCFNIATNEMRMLQNLSPDLDKCWTLVPPPEETDTDTGTDSDTDTDSDQSDSSEMATLDPSGRPIASAYPSLKEFFDGNTEYWLGQASLENADGEVNDKKLRSSAFAIAKRIWSEQQDLNMNVTL